MYTLTLNENDYLTLFLYEASRDPYSKSLRRNGIIRTALLFILFSIICYKVNPVLAYLTACFGIVYLVLGKFLTKKRYLDHYRRAVAIKYKETLRFPIQLEIADDYIKTINHIGDANYKISAIWNVYEIADHYFLKLSSGQSLIIHKTNETLNQEIQNLILKYKIDHTVDLDWKWT